MVLMNEGSDTLSLHVFRLNIVKVCVILCSNSAYTLNEKFINQVDVVDSLITRWRVGDVVFQILNKFACEFLFSEISNGILVFLCNT